MLSAGSSPPRHSAGEGSVCEAKGLPSPTSPTPQGKTELSTLSATADLGMAVSSHRAPYPSPPTPCIPREQLG